MMLFVLYNVLRFLIMLFGSVAELSYDKRSHRKLFDGEIKFERFYRYLRYASQNTFILLAGVFWDKMIELLEDDNQPKATEWSYDAMTKKEDHWMLAHSGLGCSNTNCSSEVHWRTLKGAVLGTAGKAGGGYSQLRMQSNLTLFIENDGKQS